MHFQNHCQLIVVYRSTQRHGHTYCSGRKKNLQGLLNLAVVLFFLFYRERGKFRLNIFSWACMNTICLRLFFLDLKRIYVNYFSTLTLFFRMGDILPICKPLLYAELKITTIRNGAASICDEEYKLSNKTLRVFVSQDKIIHKYQMCVLLVMFKRITYLPGQILTTQKVHP